MFPLAEPNTSKYKTSNGQLVLKSLFYENGSDSGYVLYTLKDEDHKGYPSLYKLYLSEEDITEYRFANKYFYSWEHWCKICDSPFFKPYILRWREELSLMLLERAIARIKEISDGEGKDKLSATKYLLERGWEKTPRRAGRPDKAIPEQTDEQRRFQIKTINEDYDRILQGTLN